MKKKILLGIGIGFLAVIIVVFIMVGFFLGDVVKAGINTLGPKITQTAFSVDSVSISAVTGSASLNNFVIGNPDEYKAKVPNAISVGKTAVSVAPMSVLGDKIVVKNVEVRDPEINFEGSPFGANNLKKIMDNVAAFTGPSEAKPADTNAPAAGPAKPAKKLQVDNFVIAGAKVHANITGIPGVAAREITLTIPSIQFGDLGKGPDGITTAELTQRVMKEISAATIKAVGDSAKNILNGAAGNILSGMTTNGGKASGDLIKKGLGDLFKK